MADPWVPPYFGSYEELLQALLGDPSLGSPKRGGRPLLTHSESLKLSPQVSSNPMPGIQVAGPSPEPWSPVVSFLVSMISLKEVASAMPEGPARNELLKGADGPINRFIDDYCGTPPHNVPWPWPGPPPWVYPLVQQLASVAHTFQDGTLRREILSVAGQIAQKALVSAARG